ncbi:MAG TPA: GntR family transcriptional regulator [Firmicutes bacterium]|nr:GntR family transcriptional regulator [Candidatus Fermentithermobacillaceae bacterium]
MESTVKDWVFSGLVEKIAVGIYPVGTVLPSCRRLAADLGVNKNTVNKVFKMLQEAGFVKPLPGKGMLVVARPTVSTGEADKEITPLIEQMFYRARILGVSPDYLERMFKAALAKWYDSTRLSMVLVECNSWDACSLASHIQKELPVSVTPMLLDDFSQDPETTADQYDLIVTTIYHLAEVKSLLPQSLSDRVVALQDKPSISSLLEITKIPRDATIGLVAGHERTISLIGSIIRQCGLEVSATALLSSPDDVRRLLSTVSTVVVSVRCYRDLLKYSPSIPVVTVVFEVDGQSMEFLKKKVGLLYDKRPVG